MCWPKVPRFGGLGGKQESEITDISIQQFSCRVRIILLILMIAISPAVMAQKGKRAEKEKETRNLIESRQYRFVARTALPMSGRSINLTSEYDLTVDSLQIKSYLPFFGVAYYAEYGQTDGGIKFDNKAEEYSAVFSEKKKSYRISMKVKGKRDVYQISLDAGLSGYATLNIISNDRQSISFYGTIEKLE
ncbi:MAG: DUF4251 domain-containing protein [Prolixibacteraceae bacterium]|nr:DUF4251 domain-containing protein [Prolixibacteraceae bacterium]